MHRPRALETPVYGPRKPVASACEPTPGFAGGAVVAARRLLRIPVAVVFPDFHFHLSNYDIINV
jgi:hypothetical protein